MTSRLRLGGWPFLSRTQTRIKNSKNVERRGRTYGAVYIIPSNLHSLRSLIFTMSGTGAKPKFNSSTNPNRVLLAHADEIQRRSTEVARRCQQQLSETEEVGIKTLDEIRNQNKTMTQIQDSADMTNAKLDHTQKLLNRYDRWAFHWYGRNKRQAQKEGKQVIQERKLMEKQNRKQQPSANDSKKVIDHYGKNETNRSQLFSSTGQSRIRTVNTMPIDVDGDTVASPLDEKTKNHLQHIEDQDDELDNMLSGMVESLDRLSHISKTMNDDIKQGNQQMDQVIKKVDQVNHKQFVAQSRLRRNLNK